MDILLTTNEEISAPGSTSTLSPSIRPSKSEAVEVTFIGKHKMMGLEMLAYQHFKSGAINFITFESGSFYLA
jgi:hypothetical protein